MADGTNGDGTPDQHDLERRVHLLEQRQDAMADVMSAELTSLATQMQEGFDSVGQILLNQEVVLRRHETRLDGIDGRLDGIDGRLDGIDGRLDGIDARLDTHSEILQDHTDLLVRVNSGIERLLDQRGDG